MPKASLFQRQRMQWLQLPDTSLTSVYNDICRGKCIPIPILQDQDPVSYCQKYKEVSCWWGKFSMKGYLQDMNQFPARWDLGIQEELIGHCL